MENRQGRGFHRLHTHYLFNEKRTDNEERSTQRNRPLNRIMARTGPLGPVYSRVCGWRLEGSGLGIVGQLPVWSARGAGVKTASPTNS